MARRRRTDHHIQELLGHADVKATSIYLNATGRGLHDSIKSFDRLRLQQQKTAKRSNKKAHKTQTERQVATVAERAATDKPLVN